MLTNAIIICTNFWKTKKIWDFAFLEPLKIYAVHNIDQFKKHIFLLFQLETNRPTLKSVPVRESVSVRGVPVRGGGLYIKFYRRAKKVFLFLPYTRDHFRYIKFELHFFRKLTKFFWKWALSWFLIDFIKNELFK